ncbi:MAG: EamA family transporter RarD [Gammaproteobacteria bacterium]|nr:EamA family transporter RarD [Gammaproteobacteria bacterium]
MSPSEKTSREGVIAGLSAYLMWGFLPAYFVLVREVPPTEVLAHRVLWAVPFGALIVVFRKQWPEVGRAFTHRGMLAWLSLSTLFIALNWFVYIWAIQDGRIIETSLGYYINPLTNMLAGFLFFHERLSRLQLLAVLFAIIGVSILTISGGVVPWVALALAISFTIYATVRKRVVIGGMPGLFVETVLLLPFAAVWVAYLWSIDGLTFGGPNNSLNFWLLMAGPVTALPLLCFALAARRLSLTTIGFMQFLAPTLQFGTGIYFGETLTTAHVVCFGFIWTAVAFFIFDAIRSAKKKPLMTESPGA